MRCMSLKSLDLILSLSKDEAEISAFFSILLEGHRLPGWKPPNSQTHEPIFRIESPAHRRFLHDLQRRNLNCVKYVYQPITDFFFECPIQGG